MDLWLDDLSTCTLVGSQSSCCRHKRAPVLTKDSEGGQTPGSRRFKSKNSALADGDQLDRFRKDANYRLDSGRNFGVQWDRFGLPGTIAYNDHGTMLASYDIHPSNDEDPAASKFLISMSAISRWMLPSG